MATTILSRSPGKSRDVTAGKIVPRACEAFKIKDPAHLADDIFYFSLLI